MKDPGSSSNSTPSKSRHVRCDVCGRMFGTQSIRIHLPQCLKKWHTQNDHLHPNAREPWHQKSGNFKMKASYKKFSTRLYFSEEFPEKKVPEHVRLPEVANKPPSSASSSSTSSKKPPMFPCYLCGRLFTVNSIYIHEPQCLKKWRIENDKLPPHKRRQEPQKPEIKFTRK